MSIIHSWIEILFPMELVRRDAPPINSAQALLDTAT